MISFAIGLAILSSFAVLSVVTNEIHPLFRDVFRRTIYSAGDIMWQIVETRSVLSSTLTTDDLSHSVTMSFNTSYDQLNDLMIAQSKIQRWLLKFKNKDYDLAKERHRKKQEVALLEEERTYIQELVLKFTREAETIETLIAAIKKHKSKD